MNELLRKSTRYFKTYEEREEAFRNSVFSLIPRKYSGPKLFWKDFGLISVQALSKYMKHPAAYITSNPRDCLAFGNPWQVLTAAVLKAQKADNGFSHDVLDIAKEFDIQENLYQPIRTLSGGETVKVSLAKSFIASKYSCRLTIASPFSWLSYDNSVFLEKLFRHYGGLNIPIEVFALEGEDSDGQIVRNDNCQKETDRRAIGFTLYLKGVRILLGTPLNPLYSQQTFARADDFESELFSPCLIVGKNGQGKSLIGKVLARATPFQGVAKLRCKHKSGPTRLLFQDVITQTLSRSFDAIAASSNCENEAKPSQVYEKILKEYLVCLGDTGQKASGNALKDDLRPRSLLEIKAMLVAVRLCRVPSALILDEPDWGLTRMSSIAFVSAVIRVSHDLETPVILISHKPWWFPIAKSVIYVKRSSKEIDSENRSSFQIYLRCNKPKSL